MNIFRPETGSVNVLYDVGVDINLSYMNCNFVELDIVL